MLNHTQHAGFMVRRALAEGVGSVLISDQELLGSDIAAPESRYQLQSTGQARGYTNLAGYFDLSGEWMVSGAASDYDVRATVTDTNDSNGEFTGTLDTWENLGTTREWTKQNASGTPGSVHTTLLIEIRLASSGDIIESATIILVADRS